ncbi:Protein YidD [Dissulfuribacter thermophilus]|uniref:Protein YidD n=1 Tax=Dissulfuribacter thermophilus TaxID=1156395 RepID=A0A1B9F8Y5_9BACT|nr:Protein YidD [Dissulfuribacter thermophilus]
MEAIETFGIGKGLYLAIKRLLRCHPWSLGGFDPVPLPPKKISKKRKQKTGYGVESIFSNYTFNFCFIGLSGLFSRTTKCDGTSRE